MQRTGMACPYVVPHFVLAMFLRFTCSANVQHYKPNRELLIPSCTCNAWKKVILKWMPIKGANVHVHSPAFGQQEHKGYRASAEVLQT